MAIKIIHIIRNPEIGGTEILIKNIVNENNNKDFYHVMLYSKKGPLLDLINEDKRCNLIFCKYLNPLSFIFRLRSIIVNYKIDIIHAHQAFDAILSVFATFTLKVKVVMTQHGYDGIIKNNSIKLSIKKKILYFVINKYVCMNLFVSSDLLKKFKMINSKQSAKKQKILFNGVFMNVQRQINTDIRKELGISVKSFLLGMIGGFSTASKDQLTICKTMNMLVLDNPNIHIIFIGKHSNDNSNFNDCIKYCQKNGLINNVHFIGQRNDIHDLLRNLNIYVHSSYRETFGIALIEAIMSGIPCIASDIPAFREISCNGEYVVLFKQGDPADLYDKIVSEIERKDTPTAKKRIENAKNYMKKNFTLETHLNDLHKIYMECLR